MQFLLGRDLGFFLLWPICDDKTKKNSSAFDI